MSHPELIIKYFSYILILIDPTNYTLDFITSYKKQT